MPKTRKRRPMRTKTYRVLPEWVRLPKDLTIPEQAIHVKN